VLSPPPPRQSRTQPYAHVATLPEPSWAVGLSNYQGGHPAGAGYQNALLTGLTLLLVAVVPNDAGQPPVSWRHYYQSH
jgi:hypothetical protein